MSAILEEQARATTYNLVKREERMKTGSLTGTAGARRGYRTAIFIFLALLAIVISGCGGGGSSNSTGGQQVVLARVEVPGYLEDLTLPVYQDLDDGNGTYYALVIASLDQLSAAYVSFQIIDQFVPGTRYLIAREDEPWARQEAASAVNVLYDDGDHVIVRYTPDVAETLSDISFDLKLMSDTPIISATNVPIAYEASSTTVMSPPVANFAVTLDPKVQAMINAVTEADVASYINNLSGESQITVNNVPYTLVTRDTKSGTPLSTAIQYVSHCLTAMGLTVSTPQWTFDWGGQALTNQNVVGEIRGQDNPDQIIILIAHLDSISTAEDAPGPGADDDASGCSALLEAASIMSKNAFSRTIRFVFTTGEEQALFGGTAYAKLMKSQQQNIVAVINLDMIGYTQGQTIVPPALPQMQVKTRKSANQTGYNLDQQIASTYLSVVSTYGLGTVFNAVIQDDGEVTSDQSPFWDQNYAAIWLIEYAEQGFLNPKMHTKDDRLNIMNITYCTAIVKACLGTAAHLAGVK